MAVEHPGPGSVAGLPLSAAHIRFLDTGGGAASTLVELLAVLAVAGVLLAVSLGAATGLRERARRTRARAELAGLAQALESYRRQYGEYPLAGDRAAKGVDVAPGDPVSAAAAEAALFNALLGKLGPRLDALQDAAGGAIVGRAFVEPARFSLENPAAYPTPALEAANAFLDPWGRRYQYRYRGVTAPAVWTAPVYVLFSAGPDGAVKAGDPAADGTVDTGDPANADNLYAGRD